MTSPFRSRFSALQALTVLGAAGLGASLGGMPELSHASEPLPLASLAVLAGVAGWMWWHNRGPRARFVELGVRLAPPPGRAAAPQAVLRFTLAAPRVWQARQGVWCVDLVQSHGREAGWSLVLRPSGFTARRWPLAQATTLEALLALSRRLSGRPGLGVPDEARSVVGLLEGDFEFLLPGSQKRIMALAEGGFALCQATGDQAITSQAAGAMLAQGSPVPTAGR